MKWFVMCDAAQLIFNGNYILSRSMSWFMHSNNILAIQQGIYNKANALLICKKNAVYCLQKATIFVVKSLFFSTGVFLANIYMLMDLFSQQVFSQSLIEVYTVGTH